VRSALTKPVEILATLTDIAKDAAGLAQMLQGAAGGQVTARLQWRPAIKAWGLPGVPNIFQPNDDHALHIDVEVRASASAPPAVDILAEIVDFDLNLIGDRSAGLMKLMFRRVGFHSGSTGKPDVDVVFGGIGFLGPLSFVDRLRELIPFDGFSDPPYVDVAPEGVTAGFDVTLPNIAIGVFTVYLRLEEAGAAPSWSAKIGMLTPRHSGAMPATGPSWRPKTMLAICVPWRRASPVRRERGSTGRASSSAAPRSAGWVRSTGPSRMATQTSGCPLVLSQSPRTPCQKGARRSAGASRGVIFGMPSSGWRSVRV